MPTAYTADIYEGKPVTLKDYAANCARQFGAFMHLREEPRSPLSYPKKDNYHERKLEEARRELAAWNEMNEQQRRAAYEADCEAKRQQREQHVRESAELKARYEAMLAQVEAVQVDPMLANYKEFLANQLLESIKFDCLDWEPYQRPTFEDWDAEQERKRVWDVSYHATGAMYDALRHRERLEFIDLMAKTFGFEVRPAE